MSETRSGPDLSREVPLGELLRRLVEQGSALGEAQVGMARAELAHDVRIQVRRLGGVAAAALLVVFGFQFLAVAAVLALATVLGGWLASLVFSVLFLTAGATTLLVARSRPLAPFLTKTRETLKEDLRWLRTLLS